MRVLVPYSPIDPKSRLDPILASDERAAFARAMLEDVISVLQDLDVIPEILTPEPLESPPGGVDTIVDDRSLSAAVNAALEPPMGVVMADLALATGAALEPVFDRPEDVVIVPGRGGGTNVLVVRDDRFAVDYHGNSLGDHRRIAADAGLSRAEVDSFRLSTDVDEPTDLVEVLLHGRGAAARWLRDRGFGLATTDGRVTVSRE